MPAAGWQSPCGIPTRRNRKGMRTLLFALLIGGLWACNTEAAPRPGDSDTDNTRLADSGATPGAITVISDSHDMETEMGAYTVQLNTRD